MAPSTDPWTEAHVRRLFWRAGFGATPEEAALFAKRGKAATIRWFLNGSGRASLSGPNPAVGEGRGLDPTNEWGHDGLWWLDRMVRTNRPLVEKMTLFWHDHFATVDQDTPLMLRQNKMLRGRALGDMRSLMTAVTLDPAMQLFLSLADSHKDSPNENFARELMELFTLGSGYTERDIREAARALTGFQSRWSGGQFRGIRFDRDAHDRGRKRIFGKRGRFGWRDAVDLTLDHRNHAPFMVGKLWSYFISTPIDRRSRARLVAVYRRSKLRFKPLLGEILAHPALYRDLDAPDMVKSPAVWMAGSLRQVRRGVDQDDWVWLMNNMGQQLFHPPSVAGWEWGPTWLSTNSMRARFEATSRLVREAGSAQVADASVAVGLTPAQAVEQARAAVGMPWASADTLAKLEQLAAQIYATPHPKDRKGPQRAADMAQRALRHLLLSGPDAHLH